MVRYAINLDVEYSEPIMNQSMWTCAPWHATGVATEGSYRLHRASAGDCLLDLMRLEP